LISVSRLVGAQHRLTATRSERHASGSNDEVGPSDLAVVDQVDHHRLRDQWSELLSQIEGQGRSTKARTVVEADVGIEPDSEGCRGEVLHQQGIEVGEEAVDGVERGATIPMQEVEACTRQALVVPQHLSERAEVEPGCCTFDAEQRADGLGRRRLPGQKPE
jgi:hypothetical protein